MPTYTWHCKTCDHDTEITRPMSESDKGPDNGCEKCKGEVTKVIREANFQLQGTGWHRDSYTRYRSRN